VVELFQPTCPMVKNVHRDFFCEKYKDFSEMVLLLWVTYSDGKIQGFFRRSLILMGDLPG
jgi:hypothetical protein